MSQVFRASSNVVVQIGTITWQCSCWVRPLVACSPFVAAGYQSRVLSWSASNFSSGSSMFTILALFSAISNHKILRLACKMILIQYFWLIMELQISTRIMKLGGISRWSRWNLRGLLGLPPLIVTIRSRSLVETT